MTRAELQKKIEAYQRAAAEAYEQQQRAIGAIFALTEMLNAMPPEPETSALED